MTYVASFLFFSYLRSLIIGTPFLTEIVPLTGPMYQLFIFFMLTDQATTVSIKKGQMRMGPAAMVVHLQLKHSRSLLPSGA